MHITQVAIVANGHLEKSLLSEIRKSDYIIGIDRGAYWLLKQGITPQSAIGDFDSCTKLQYKAIKKSVVNVQIYPAEKDKTDLELAADHAISLNPKKVIIYGATGKRLDHELASVFLLKRLLDTGIEGIIKDMRNEVFLVHSRIEIPRLKRFTYLSLLPYIKSITVTLRGFKYNVLKKTISQGETLGVSNEILNKVGVVNIHKGIAIVIKSRD